MLLDPALLNVRLEAVVENPTVLDNKKAFPSKDSSILGKQFVYPRFELHIDKHTVVVTSTATPTQLAAVPKYSFAV